MKLKAVLYIDDDGLGGALSIFDEPCSSPTCVHADLPLSPGEVETVVAYVECVMRGGDVAHGWAARHNTRRSIAFRNEGIYVNFYDGATFTISKDDVLIDMSNEFGNWSDNLGDIDARAAIEEVE